jgi:para-aminobenzoate synthetase component I
MAGHSIAHNGVHLAHRQTLDQARTDTQFLAIARQVALHPFSTVLLSGGAPSEGTERRYSLAAWDPFLIFTAKGAQCRIRMGASVHCMEEDPLSVLDELMHCIQPDEDWFAPPFAGGALGYFAYDLKNVIEKLPQSAEDECGLPDLWLIWPKQLIVHDRLNQSITHLVLRYDHSTDSDSSRILALRSTALARESSARIGLLQSNFTRAEYMEAVGKVREYIAAGDVYQVNLSQRYRFDFSGNAFSLWESMFSLNPAAFYAYLHCGDHKILSTSMERFLYKNGDLLETRPIKGTRKRGNTPAEDEALRMDLLSSPKDAAELSMIVDLLRNDLGRVCIPRSVRVVEHKRLESYQNVHHLVSIVTGRVNPKISYGEIVRATFPGGSITGCPKIRAMEIIDELESVVRHVYTGSIGYLGWHGNMDLSIAIRTAVIHNNVCYFSVGGGIVFDSNDADEYEETLHKGRTFFDIIRGIGCGNEKASG